MELPYIVLHTKERNGFQNCDGYLGVADSDLKALLLQCREAVLSLEAEIEQRQNMSLKPDLTIQAPCQKLQESANSLKILGRLNVRDKKLVASAVEILKTTQTSRTSKVYQLFLLDIQRYCGNAITLLCAASLGKQRVISLNEKGRTSLVHWVKRYVCSLASPALDLLAEEYGLPDKIKKRNRSEDQGQSPEENDCHIGSSKRRLFGTQEAESCSTVRTGDTATKGGGSQLLDMMQTDRQIERMYSNGPIGQVSLLGELLGNATQNSNNWKKERDLGEPTINCWTIMIPRDPNQDISITIWLGRKDGHRVNVALMVEPTWSSPSRLLPQNSSLADTPVRLEVLSLHASLTN